MKIEVGQIIKATTKLSESVRFSDDGFLNFRNLTSIEGKKKTAANIQRPMFWYKDSDGYCPALIFSSNPLLKDRETKPWTEIFNLSENKVRYFGDNKTPGLDPSVNIPGNPQTGNNKMISLLEYYLGNTKELREQAPPIVVFLHSKVDKKSKGYRKFIGVGYLYNYELVEQKTAKGEMFSNYRYDINLIPLEDNQFDWQWISDRRGMTGSIVDKNLKAPEAWKTWIKEGHKEVLVFKDYSEIEEQFNSQVSSLLKNGKIQIPAGNITPNSSTAFVKQIQRDPAVKAWVLQNSEGICESCQSRAPFEVDDGRFYLEVHHIKQLALNGSDRIENAVALCPNCHREIHYGKNRVKIVEALYQNISRLVREE